VNLKTSAGSAAMEQVLYKPPGSHVIKLDAEDYAIKLSRIADMFFGIDGMTPRQVMPYPHQPLRPQPWHKYDSMSVQDRLDQLDLTQEDKDLFVAQPNSFGSSHARDTAWTDALRWYALGGYSFATMFDAVGCFKLGNGGMTNFARHILDEYAGDRALNKVVTSVKEVGNVKVVVSCADGSSFVARRVVCTIPLNCLTDVQFDPPLSPLKQQAATRGHINLGEKYHISMNEVQNNWFATTSDTLNSDFLFGIKDHDGMWHEPSI